MSDYSSYNEKDLLGLVAEGNEDAFRQLFAQWSSRLYNFTYQLVGSKETAEDIVQDSFLKIWLRRDRLLEIDNFSAYLFRMSRNAVSDGLRRRALLAGFQVAETAVQGYDTENENQLDIKLVKSVLEQAVRKLPEQQERVWRLRREYGKRIKEIAVELGISETTVKAHLNRASTRLKEELLREFPLEGGILLILLEFALQA